MDDPITNRTSALGYSADNAEMAKQPFSNAPSSWSLNQPANVFRS